MVTKLVSGKRSRMSISRKRKSMLKITTSAVLGLTFILGAVLAFTKPDVANATTSSVQVSSTAQIMSAIAPAQPGDVVNITATADFNINNTITIPVGVTVNLTSDTGSRVLLRDPTMIDGGYSTGKGVLFHNYGFLTLSGIIIDGNKEGGVNALSPLIWVDGDPAGAQDSSGLTINDGAILRNNNNIYTGRTSGPTLSSGGAILAIIMNNASTQLPSITMNSGEIYGNIIGGSYGGTILLYPGKMTMTGGEIYDNQAGWGGGIDANLTVGHILHSIFTMTGGKIHNNTATYQGGGVAFGQASTGVFSGGEIYNNVANYAGGVNVGNFSNVTMTGGKIYGNEGTSGGGGMYVGSSSTFTMENGEIYDNFSPTGPAGGIWVDNHATMTMAGGRLQNNSSASEAGGILVTNAKLYAKGTALIADNTATTDGGGIYVASTGTAEISGTATLTGNTANADPSTFATNNGSGGGIYTEDYTNLTVGPSVTFVNNSAKGAYLLEQANDPTNWATYHETATLSDSSTQQRVAAMAFTVPFQFGSTIALDGTTTVTANLGYNNYDINYFSSLLVYTVIFDSQGGATTPDPQAVLDGGTAIDPADLGTEPIRDGYEFTGWCLDAECSGGVYDFATAINGNITLYAQWEKLPEPPEPPVTPPIVPEAPSTGLFDL